MGEIADYYQESMDFGENPEDYEDFRVRRSKFKACNRCGKKGLEWKQIDYGNSIKWRLADKKTGDIHVCEEPKARGGLKSKK